MCIEDVNHYVWNTLQIGKTYLPLKNICYKNLLIDKPCQLFCCVMFKMTTGVFQRGGVCPKVSHESDSMM